MKRVLFLLFVFGVSHATEYSFRTPYYRITITTGDVSVNSGNTLKSRKRPLSDGYGSASSLRKPTKVEPSTISENSAITTPDSTGLWNTISIYPTDQRSYTHRIYIQPGTSIQITSLHYFPLEYRLNNNELNRVLFSFLNEVINYPASFSFNFIDYAPIIHDHNFFPRAYRLIREALTSNKIAFQPTSRGGVYRSQVDIRRTLYVNFNPNMTYGWVPEEYTPAENHNFFDDIIFLRMTTDQFEGHFDCEEKMKQLYQFQKRY